MDLVGNIPPFMNRFRKQFLTPVTASDKYDDDDEKVIIAKGAER